MKSRRRIYSRLLIIANMVVAGCSGLSFIQEVPPHLIPGKLYLTPITIEVGGKEFKAEEGFIVVNENPSDTLSRKNMLPVLKIFSSNRNHAEPIFWLNGGPGLSNMKYRPMPALLENHDFVLIGYRGVDGSVNLQSDEIVDAMEGDGRDLLGDNSLKNLSRAVERFAYELRANGVDLSHYTMVDVISDLETARKALGYGKINLFSASYGTRLALIYSYLHPDVLCRSAMMCVNPPGRFIWSPKKIDEQLQYYDSLFATDKNHYDGRSLSYCIKKALKNVPSRWTIFRLDPGKIKATTFAMLFLKGSAALVFDCYLAAEDGDYSGLYMMQLAYDFIFPSSMVWGDLFAKGGTDFDPSVDYVSSLRDTSTVMGSPLSLLINESAQGHWPVFKIAPELCKIQPSKVQTLLISGSVDFSTPPDYATELLKSLENGKQVILKEMGHFDDIINLQRAALTNLLVRFYDEGVVDDSKYVYDPMNFEPQVNFPLWAKILYPFIFVFNLFW